MVVVVPLVLGLLQLGLVLHIRNTLTAAASEGARYAATVDRSRGAGVERTRSQISTALAGRFARQVSARQVLVDGVTGVEVQVRAEVPPLGLWGPGISLVVSGHAVEEVEP